MAEHRRLLGIISGDLTSHTICMDIPDHLDTRPCNGQDKKTTHNTTTPRSNPNTEYTLVSDTTKETPLLIDHLFVVDHYHGYPPESPALDIRLWLTSVARQEPVSVSVSFYNDYATAKKNPRFMGSPWPPRTPSSSYKSNLPPRPSQPPPSSPHPRTHHHP